MYLDESNIGSLLAEALTADVKTVLADETGLVGADAAVFRVSSYVLLHVRAHISPYSSYSPFAQHFPRSSSSFFPNRVYRRIVSGLGS